MEQNYSILNNVIYFIKYFKKYEPAVLMLSAAEIILGAAIPLIGIYLPKITIDLIEQGISVEKVTLMLGIFTVMIMAVYGFGEAVSFGKYFKYNSQRSNLTGMLFLKSLRVRYKDTESGPGKIAYDKARDVVNQGDWSASSRIVTGTVSLITNVLCFLLYSTVLAVLNIWVLAALVGISLVNYFVLMSRIKYRESRREEEAIIHRHYYAVKAAMGDVSAAKDIRIYHMNPWLVKLRDHVLEELKGLYRQMARRDAWSEKMGFLLGMIRDFLAYGYLIYQACRGLITVGDFVLYFGAVTGFSNFVMEIMGGVAQLREAANSNNYYRAYMELPEEDRVTGTRHISELTTPMRIEFQDVCFSYQWVGEEEKQETKKIFDHFSLTIEAGEKIALVGVNGAGKTTFVKLLCGMYEPDSGKILINGIDRKEFPKQEWYELFSVVFQEQLILPFTVGENLTLQTADNIDVKRSWEALEQAGLRALFEEKKIGLDSYMKKIIVKDGVELSGGQQQRFLLARALYKDGPVLVLDEPTAALDPIGESEIYERYHAYSRDKTAIFISHRLASTRFSDRIVMIEDGKILEMGSHSELMEKQGAYASMYQVQSNYYQN